MRSLQQTVYPKLNVAPLPVTSQQLNTAGVFSYDEEIKRVHEIMFFCVLVAQTTSATIPITFC